MDKDLKCSFCGKSQTEVKRLIASPTGDSFICDECIDVCKEIIKDEKISIPQTKIDLPLPHEIKDMLDDYIQQQTKTFLLRLDLQYNHPTYL